MRLLCGTLLVVAVLPGQDAREILRRSLELEKRNSEATRNYTFLQRQQRREIDSSGKVKNVESDTYDLTLLEGSPYRRHVARNDRPLSAKELAKEEEKLRRSIEDRRQETPEQRERRIREAEDKRKKQREPMEEIPDAFDLKLASEEAVEGIACWVIEATPRPGYRPKHTDAKFFSKVKGRIWVAKQDYAWVKIDMVTLDTISFGGFLLRMATGSRLEYQTARVNNEVWLPKRLVLTGAMRVALVKVLRGDVTYDFSDYKKFQADSRVVSTGQ
jgi:hypothetical protein